MSLYRFVKSSSSSMSDSRQSGSGGPSRRLFVEATRENDDRDNIRDVSNDVQDLQAVHTRRHLSTDVYGSSEESNKRFKSAGTKYITTRVLRKTTTMTRGEEKSTSESLMRSAETNMIQHQGSEKSANRSYHSKSKRAKVKLQKQDVAKTDFGELNGLRRKMTKVDGMRERERVFV